MSEKLSIQDYYYQQKRIAETYNISDSHAGCYITHYPNINLCGMCKKAELCRGIHKQEKEHGYA